MERDPGEASSATGQARQANPLDEFIEAVRSRRATRHFRPDQPSPELIERLIEAARWAPSGFNLQPTHFVVVTDAEVKAKLYPACMKQRQVLEAGATVVFTGDRRVVERQFERVLQQDREAGAINDAYERLLRKAVPLSFNQGPLGVGWVWKAAAEAVLGPFIPLPSIQAVHKDFWLAKQVSLSAMVFMLGAQLAGLATCPMEGFSERGVRRVLSIPASHAVILVVPVGYADNSGLKKTRVPLQELVHRNQW